MSGGPIKRLVATLGLIAMIPIGYQLVTGSVSVTDAAIRAGITLVAVVFVSSLARRLMEGVISSIERQVPHRRASDRPGDAS